MKDKKKKRYIEPVLFPFGKYMNGKRVGLFFVLCELFLVVLSSKLNTRKRKRDHDLSFLVKKKVVVSGESLFAAEAQLKVLACVLIGGKGFVFFGSSKEPKNPFLFNLFEKAQQASYPHSFFSSHIRRASLFLFPFLERCFFSPILLSFFFLPSWQRKKK